ncbi:M50 family metallopeptidase [Paractinoplanes rhizophilus]|uniref:M50 family metallopeptidase n=1 Tax=Paractinoplanes rhizophilus TaxID=1416877 RepID=A0ABW2HT35_9ACTN
MASDVGMAWTTGVVAFVAAVPLWKYTTHAITIAHEGGHAMFGSLTGLFVKRIRIDRGGAGETAYSKDIKDLSLLETLMSGLAGYLGPSLFGLAGAWMLVHGISPRSVLLMTLLLMAMLLVMVRNLFGLFVVPLTGALIWVVAMRATEQVQLVFAYVWVWFLLMGGTRQIPELFSVWKEGSEPDTRSLSDKSGLSSAFFVALFWAASLAALVYGGVLLLRHPV